MPYQFVSIIFLITSLIISMSEAGVRPTPPVMQQEYVGKIIKIEDTNIFIALENGTLLRVRNEDIKSFDLPTSTIVVVETGDAVLPYKMMGTNREYYLENYTPTALPERWLLIKANPRIFQIESLSYPYLKLVNPSKTDSLEVTLPDATSPSSVEHWEEGDFVYYVDVMASSNKGRWMFAGALAHVLKNESELIQFLNGDMYSPGVWIR